MAISIDHLKEAQGGRGRRWRRDRGGVRGGVADYNIHISYFGSTTVTIPLGKRWGQSSLQHDQKMKRKTSQLNVSEFYRCLVLILQSKSWSEVTRGW